MQLSEQTLQELSNNLETLRNRLCIVETERRDLMQTFSLALEQGKAAVYRRNFDKNVYEYIGAGIQDITGYSSSAITPSLWDSLVISVENRGELAGLPLQEAYDRVRHGFVERWISDTQLRTSDGEIRWVMDLSTVLRDSMGHCYGCLGILLDITDRKYAEKQLANTSEELRKRNEQFQDDLNMAREVQRVFIAKQLSHFPVSVSPDKGLIRFYHRYIPAHVLGGDFFSIFPITEHTVGIMICDVMGHGTRASLLTAYISGLIEELKLVAGDPANFIRRLNNSFCTLVSRSSGGFFASVFYLVVDIVKKTLMYSNAGHPPALLLQKREQRIVQLSSINTKDFDPALGFMKDYKYSAEEIPFQSDDSVLFFTDGIYEVVSADGELFKREDFCEMVKRNLSLSPGQLLDAILQQIQDINAEREFCDDVCLVTMQLI